jgi:hypothetical protein
LEEGRDESYCARNENPSRHEFQETALPQQVKNEALQESRQGPAFRHLNRFAAR